MILNHEEIKNSNLIEDSNVNEFSNGSYNLTIGKILDMENNIHTKFILKPQGMVYVIFKEKVNIPDNIIGFAHVKTSLTKRGIMATNIGIIDPNYIGYISTLLINFGKTDYLVNQNESALKVTFSKLNEPKVNIELSNNDKSEVNYIIETQKNILNLDDKFLNLNSVEKLVKEDVESKIFSRIRNFGWVFGGLAFLIGSTIQFKGCTDRTTDAYITNYEVELKNVNESNKLLIKKFDKAQYDFKVFKDSLNKKDNGK